MSNDLIEEVRLLAPAVEPRSEIARARQRAKLAEAIADEAGGGTVAGAARSPRLRVRRWLPAGAAIVGLAVAGGGIAAAVTLLGPTPQQAKSIYQHYYPNQGAGHIPGTRPTLNAELVLCDYRDLPSLPADPELLPKDNSGNPVFVEAFASNEPLTESLTEESLVSACTNEPTSLRDAAIPASVPATLCVTGQPTSASPGDWPVVVFGGTTCAAAGDEPAPDGLLDQINQHRSIEASIDAIPESCPTETQAVNWVKSELANLDLNYPIQATNSGPGGTCYLPYVQWWQFAGTTGNPEQPVVEVNASQQSAATSSNGQETTTTTLPPSGNPANPNP
jgi:hypothetical protein